MREQDEVSELEDIEGAEDGESAEAERAAVSAAGAAGWRKRKPAQRVFLPELDDEILKAGRKLLSRIPEMVEKNAANVLALRRAVEAATKSYQARKKDANQVKVDERRRRMLENPPLVRNPKLEEV